MEESIADGKRHDNIEIKVKARRVERLYVIIMSGTRFRVNLLAKWLSVRLQTKWLWVRIPLLSLRVERPEDSAKVIQEFKEIIRSNRNNIIRLAYQQGMIFRKYKKRENFVRLLANLVSKSTIFFKIAIVKLINEYPKMKNSALHLNFFEEEYEKYKRDIQRN